MNTPTHYSFDVPQNNDFDPIPVDFIPKPDDARIVPGTEPGSNALDLLTYTPVERALMRSGVDIRTFNGPERRLLRAVFGHEITKEGEPLSAEIILSALRDNEIYFEVLEPTERVRHLMVQRVAQEMARLQINPLLRAYVIARLGVHRALTPQERF